MRKFLYGIAGAIVIAVAVGLIAPSLIDWNAYKDNITRALNRVTGRVVVIQGDIDFAVLPAPKLTVGAARLANLEGAKAKDMVRLKYLDVRVALLPLLSGRIEIKSIGLVEPVIELEILADGRNNWDFGGAAPAAPAKDGAGPGSEDKVSRMLGQLAGIRLDRLVIVNGTITFRNSAERTVKRVEKLNLNISAKSLMGPLEAAGKMRHGGADITFKARLGRLDGLFGGGGRTPAEITIELPGAPAQITVRGALAAPAAGHTFTGSFESSGPDLAAFASTLSAFGGGGDELPGLLARKFEVKGKLAMTTAGIEANELALELGTTRGTGAVNVILGEGPRIDVALSFNRIDLDRWLAESPKRPAGKPAPPKPRRRGGILPVLKAQNETPDLRGSVDVTVDAVVYRGGVVRQAKFNASFGDGKLKLHQFAALLPGGSDVSLTGLALLSQENRRFDGSVEAVSDNFRGVLNWLKIDTSKLPPGRVHKVSLTANIAAMERQISIESLDLRFDASRVTGGIVLALRARPSFGANLIINRLNLDAYLPAAPESGGGPMPAKPAQSKAPAKAGPGVLAVLDGFDANLKLRVDRLTYNRVPVRNIRFNGTLFGGELTLRRASIGRVAGGKISLTGNIRGFAETLDLDIHFKGSTEDPSRLLQFGGMEASIADFGRIDLSGRVRGTVKRLKLDATLKSGKAGIGIAGELRDLDAEPAYSLYVKARHPNFTEFVQSFDKGFKPPSPKLGVFALEGRVQNTARGIALSDLKGMLGPVELKGTGGIDLQGPRPKLTARLSAGEIDSNLFLAAPPRAAKPRRRSKSRPARAARQRARWSREPIELAALRSLDADITLNSTLLVYRNFRISDPRAEIKLRDGVLKFERLGGKMFGGNFVLTGEIGAASAGGPVKTALRLDVTGANLRQALFNAADLDVADGIMNLNMNLVSTGRNQRQLVSNLNGTAALQVRNGAVRGFNLAAVNTQLKRLDRAIDFFTLLQTAMSGGITRFSTLDGTFTVKDGVAESRNLSLIAEGGEGRAVVVAELLPWLIEMNAEFRLSEHPKAPPFGMRLTGPLDNPRRIFKTNRLQAYLVQRGVGSVLKRFLPRKSAGPTAPIPPQPSQQQPAQPPQPQPLPKPEDFIRDILKGLGR
ncbi:MAG: AsmA family protein [Alphaproteobacteria bacterium]